MAASGPSVQNEAEEKSSPSHPSMVENETRRKKLFTFTSLQKCSVTYHCAKNDIKNSGISLGGSTSKAVAVSGWFSLVATELVANASSTGCLQREKELCNCPSISMQTLGTHCEDAEVVSNSGTVMVEDVLI
jgi:hypothetical protein